MGTKMSDTPSDKARNKAIDDCSRVLAQKGVTEIGRKEWDQMIQDRMRVLAAERLSVWPASKVGRL